MDAGYLELFKPENAKLNLVSDVVMLSSANVLSKSLKATTCIWVLWNCGITAYVRVLSTLSTTVCDWWTGKWVDGWMISSSDREVDLALRLSSQTKQHQGKHMDRSELLHHQTISTQTDLPSLLLCYRTLSVLCLLSTQIRSLFKLWFCLFVFLLLSLFFFGW